MGGSIPAAPEMAAPGALSGHVYGPEMRRMNASIRKFFDPSGI